MGVGEARVKEGKPGLSFYNKLGLGDRKMMVAHKVIGVNMLRITNSGCYFRSGANGIIWTGCGI